MGTGTESSDRGMGGLPAMGFPRRRTISSTYAFTAAAEADQPLRYRFRYPSALVIARFSADTIRNTFQVARSPAPHPAGRSNKE